MRSQIPFLMCVLTLFCCASAQNKPTVSEYDGYHILVPSCRIFILNSDSAAINWEDEIKQFLISGKELNSNAEDMLTSSEFYFEKVLGQLNSLPMPVLLLAKRNNPQKRPADILREIVQNFNQEQVK